MTTVVSVIAVVCSWAVAGQVGNWRQVKIIGCLKNGRLFAGILCLPGKLRWHFIGHLQSNKSRDAVQLFSMIQSVDSLSLAQEINKRADEAAKTMPVLLEVNLAGEASMFGYPPEQLLAELKEINSLPRIEIHGLMTVPPWSPNAENWRPHFRRLRELKSQCEEILSAPLPHLSMGMSGDFEVAIEEGATIIRIGTALFGPRRSKAQ
jgi:PLP dependent protein